MTKKGIYVVAGDFRVMFTWITNGLEQSVRGEDILVWLAVSWRKLRERWNLKLPGEWTRHRFIPLMIKDAKECWLIRAC